MGISFRNWFNNTFNVLDDSEVCASLAELEKTLAYKTFAVNLCINLIAQTISLAEFQTFENNKETKKDLYYLLNVEPNQNKSSSEFWRDAIERLVFNDACLIVNLNEKFYTAVDWDIEERAMVDNLYKNVAIGTDKTPYSLKENYIQEHQVLVFRWHNYKLDKLINGIYEDFSKLIAASNANYQKNSANKGVIYVNSDYPKTTKAQNELKDLMGKHFKKFFAANGSAVLPLTKGLEYTELSGASSRSSSSNISRDTRGFIDDIIDIVGMSFFISGSLIRGDFADLDNVVKQFITFCINPIAKIITDEINRKLYGKSQYLKGNYVKLDTSRIRAVDIKDVASSLDILERIGAYTINDSLKILGKEPLSDEVGNQRWMTKNYSPVENQMKEG